MDPIDAIADAIMNEEGWFPGSIAYRHRNPGNLKEIVTVSGQKTMQWRTFASLPAGYDALVEYIEKQFHGYNDHGLNGASTLLAFFEVYSPAADKNNPFHYAEIVAQWLNKVFNATVTPAWTLDQILTLAPSAAYKPGAPAAPTTLPNPQMTEGEHMNLLALILGFLQLAPELIAEILGVITHARNPTNTAAAKTALTAATTPITKA